MNNAVARRVALVALLAVFASLAGAQDDAASPTVAAPAAEAGPTAGPHNLGLKVPRGTVAGFLDATDRKNYVEASRFLDLRNLAAGLTVEDGPQLAEDLSEVLQRKLWIDFENLSAEPDGKPDDGLPSYRDLLGTIDTPDGPVELYVQRIPDGEGASIWKISTATVALIPTLHERYGEPPIVDRFERFVPEGSFLGVEYSKWTIALLAAALMFLFGRPAMSGLALVFTRAGSPYRPRIRKLLRGPVLFVVILLMLRMLFQHMGIGLTGQAVARTGTTLTIALVWTLFSVVNLVRDVFVERMKRDDQRDAVALVRPGVSFIKILMVLVALVAWLENLGFNVTTLIAGLGVGGIAVALALQRPLEDLIAAVTLYSQQTIRTGDFCHFGNVRGTVEEIGLRNTRIRTLRDTVVSIPNSRVVHESIDNFSAREKFLYETVLSLSRATTADQLRKVLAGLTEIVEKHEKVMDGYRVRFVEFGGQSFDIKVFLYVDTRQVAEYQAIIEELNLAFMEVINRDGEGFADRLFTPAA